MQGKEFRKWRRINDITQKRVADAVEVNESIISKWENEKIAISVNLYNKIDLYKNMVDMRREVESGSKVW